MAGGTKDIGYKLEVNSGAYGALAERYRNYGGATSDLQYVEYAVLAGNADADYYLSALGRSMNRFSTRFTETVYDASLSCTPQAVTSDVKSAKAEVTLTMKEDIAKQIKSTNKASGMRAMSDKFMKPDVLKNDLICDLHNDIEKMKDITATSLAEAIKAGLISLDVEYNTIFPLELKKRNKESANVLKMGKNAEKLGQWCAGMNLIQIEEILKVRF